MTLDQIDQMVRQANPVPDLMALEPVDTSVLVLDQRRRMEMQTHDRVEVDQEPEKPGRGLLIGIAAAAAVVIGVLILVRPMDDAPVTAEPTTAVDIAAAFVEAFGAFDVDGAASYLAADAVLSVGGSDVEGMRLESRWLEAQGFKVLLDSCVERAAPSGTWVTCTFDFHGIRSDEIGLGPFSGSYFDFRILDGEIVSASWDWGTVKFAPQMWEPFAAWVAENYPDDVAIMYLDSSQSSHRNTEESTTLWEQHSRQYVVEASRTPVAERIATAFVEFYGAFDMDGAASYLAANASLSVDGSDVEVQGMRLGNRGLEAQGFQLLLDSCEEQASSPTGTVRCTFDFHGLRSDEIGLAPFSGSYFDFRILDREIVSASLQWENDEFSVQMWEPFATWVSENYPDDVAIMYTDFRGVFGGYEMNSSTLDSIRLWEQHSREYVVEVGSTSG